MSSTGPTARLASSICSTAVATFSNTTPMRFSSAASDFRLAADGPYQIGLPEAVLGILPGGSGTQRLPRLIGRGKALEVMLFGNVYSPRDAERMGMVNRVLAPDTLMAFAMGWARTLAKRPPRSVAAIKRAVYLGADLKPIRTFRSPGPAHADASHPSNLFYQPQLEAILRDGLTRFAGVEVRLGQEVRSVRQDDGVCTVTATDRNGEAADQKERRHR